MDFGRRSIKKRAKLIDKKLDEIVANPYAEQTIHSHNKVKKPLFITLGAAAACLCVAFGTFGVVEVLKHNNSNKGNVSFNPSNPSNTDPIKPNPSKGKTPKVDIKNYVSVDFGYPEFSYFSFFANSLSQPKMMAPHGEAYEDNEEKEFTIMPPMESYYDDEGRYHEPLPIWDTYGFSDFLYFEFTTTDDTFLEGRIGNGNIQALSVHTNVYDEDILVFKNGNKFYSCLGNGKKVDNKGKVLEIGFSSQKYIEEWDIVKDTTNDTSLNIYFKTGKGYEGAAVMEINNKSYDINADSVFYLNYSFDIAVNQVRTFLGLDPDPKFDGTNVTLPPLEINFNDGSFILEEFGSTPFKREKITTEGYPFFSFNGNEIVLEGYCTWRDSSVSFFAADINNDGYRDFVYEFKGEMCYLVKAYDFHNNVFLTEDTNYYRNTIWFKIHNNKLVVYQSNGYEDPNEEIVYDYADIVCDLKNDGISLSWWNIYQVDIMDLIRIEDYNKNTVNSTDNSGAYTIDKDKTYYFILAIKRYTQKPDIATFTPEKAGITCTDANQNVFYSSTQYEEISNNYYSIGLRFREGNYELFFNLSGLETVHLKINAI